MKIAEILEAYRKASAKVSEQVRQLALAGIATVWLFKVGGENAGGIHFSRVLLWPLGLFVSSLAADLLQYIYFTLVWGIMNTIQWNRWHDNEKIVRVNRVWNWVGDTLFWVKASLLIAGYFCLIAFIVDNL